jgi:hypothetical protein
MGAWNFEAIVAGLLVAGCGYTVQPGLANAPVPASPETRVHDVVANGNDACERAMFPQGEVLRGHVPPCTKETPPRAWSFVPYGRSDSAVSAPFPLEVCPPPLERHGLSGDKAMTAFPLSERGLWLACNAPSGVGQSR